MTQPQSTNARISVLESRQKGTDKTLAEMSDDLGEVRDKVTELLTMSKLGRTVLIAACTAGPTIGVLISKFTG